MTNSENQPEDKSPTFTKGQEVWIPARIANPKPDSDGDIRLYITSTLDVDWEPYCHPSKIRTTEQIILENTTMDSPTMYRFFDPVYGAQNAKNTPQNTEPTAISKTETVTDKTINIMLCLTEEEYNQLKHCVSTHEPCGEYEEKLDETIYNKLSNANSAVITFVEPDRTRKFKKGDKVRVVKRWGRPLKDQEDFEDWGFKVNEVYEVLENEDCDNAVKLINGGHCWYFPFYALDLVEPAPAPKYWLHESDKTYSIYFKGESDKVLAAMILRKNLYTLEEAQEQLDKLIQKDQDNGI